MQRHDGHYDETDAAFDALLSRALESYESGQRQFSAEVSGFEHWRLTQDCLSFTSETGGSKRFGVIPIGSYLPAKQSWAWAWANDAFTDQQRLLASNIKQLATETGYEIFNSASFRVPPHDLGELCALARYKLGAHAVFNDKSEEPWVYHAVLAGPLPGSSAAA